ncbi:DMT family transporter [Teredinibacter turnerae]|uniref:DMT family transporter n=1 Tax=Teredinibacter turnerae TaxID=2426 RepID=UPI0005F81B4D|nr:DMT family transporter [Teredinibacter turnerae]
MVHSSSQKLPVAVLLAASIIWGLSWLPLKFIHQQGIDGVPLVLVSHSLMALLMLIAKPSWSQLCAYRGWLLGIGIAGGAAITSFTYALMHGDVIRVMVLFYLVPVWGVLGGWIFLREHTGVLRWLGVLLALGGAYLILGGRAIFTQPPSWIDMIALLAGIAFAANNLLFRGVDKVDLATKLSAMFIGCALVALLLLALGAQEFPTNVGYLPWGWVILYSVTFLLAANIGSQWSVSLLEAGKSSVIMIMELVAAVVSAMFVAGESLAPLEWLGCALIVSAALLEAYRPPAALAPM